MLFRCDAGGINKRQKCHFRQCCDKLRWIVDALRQYEASKPRFLLSGCMARKLLNVQRFRCLIFLFF